MIFSFITSTSVLSLLSQPTHSNASSTRAPRTPRLTQRASQQRQTPLMRSYATAAAPYVLPRVTAPSEKDPRCTLRVFWKTPREAPRRETPVHQAKPRHSPCCAPTAPTTPPHSHPLPQPPQWRHRYPIYVQVQPSSVLSAGKTTCPS